MGKRPMLCCALGGGGGNRREGKEVGEEGREELSAALWRRRWRGAGCGRGRVKYVGDI